MLAELRDVIVFKDFIANAGMGEVTESFKLSVTSSSLYNSSFSRFLLHKWKAYINVLVQVLIFCDPLKYHWLMCIRKVREKRYTRSNILKN